MASLSPFFPLLLCLFLLDSSTSSFTKTSHQNFYQSSTQKLSKSTIERLIRKLNLFPKHDMNIVANHESTATTALPLSIVEKRFQLSYLGDSGTTVEDLAHHAGYFRLPHTKAARIFYFFFESRRSKADPVLIWLTGGPGCASEVALFYENGPFHITSNGSLVWNDFGWDKVSNIIYVDQPTGTGFSYSSSKDDIRKDGKGVTNDLIDFLQAFFEKHPQYAKNDFYITGESYAGHFIPALASRIHQGNKNHEGTFINLKGFAIGNGMTNPEIQFQAHPDYALQMQLISQADYNSLNNSVTNCVQAAHICDISGTDGQYSSCLSAVYVCNHLLEEILSLAGGDLNYYDIRKKCEGKYCYDFSDLEDFLNEKTVRAALGVGDVEFVLCNSKIAEAMAADVMRNLEVGIPALVEDGIKLLVYAGEYDFRCNWLGNLRWVEAMEWSGQKNFISAPTVPFIVDNVEAGLQKGHGTLNFLKVYNAGHMVPMDQPEASLEMLKRWINGNLTAHIQISAP